MWEEGSTLDIFIYVSQHSTVSNCFHFQLSFKRALTFESKVETQNSNIQKLLLTKFILNYMYLKLMC